MLIPFKEHQSEDIDYEEVSDVLDDTYQDIVGYMNEVKGSEDLGYKIDSMVEMLDAVRAYLAFSTAALLNMRLTKDR